MVVKCIGYGCRDDFFSMRGEGGARSFVACLIHLIVDQASRSRRRGGREGNLASFCDIYRVRRAGLFRFAAVLRGAAFELGLEDTRLEGVHAKIAFSRGGTGGHQIFLAKCIRYEELIWVV